MASSVSFSGIQSISSVFPATPGHPQHFPGNPVNFKGSFDWHGEIVVFTGTAPRGKYKVCGYMLAAKAPSSRKPLALAAANFKVS